MTRLPGNRLLAWLVDWVAILVWAALVAAVGVPLFLSGATRGIGTLTLNLISALLLVVPVTIALALQEGGRRHATIGKRVRCERVIDVKSGQGVTFWPALARNAVKVALPWLIGHAAVYAIVESSKAGSVSPGVWILTGAAYVLPIVYVVSLFVGSGRTPYDLVSGTRVVRD